MRVWTKLIRCLLVVLTCVLFVSNTTLAEDIDDPTVTQLAENLYRVVFPFSLHTNIGVFTGPDGILLVDTGFEETADALNTVLHKLGHGDVEYIINTHLHGDHVSGNWICGKNATMVDFENLEECMSYGFVFPGNGDLEGKLEGAFGTYYSLNFNGDKIQIIPCTDIHSDADLLVYFSKSGVIHMGDLLLSQSFPAVGSHVKEYMDFLDKIVDIFPPETKFIAGHGRDYTMDDLKDYRQMLQTTIGIVQNEMEAGKSLKQIQKALVLKKWDSWGEFLTFLNCDTWIEFIFTSYPELFIKKSNTFIQRTLESPMLDFFALRAN